MCIRTRDYTVTIDLPCLTETSVTLQVTGESTNLENMSRLFEPWLVRA